MCAQGVFGRGGVWDALRTIWIEETVVGVLMSGYGPTAAYTSSHRNLPRPTHQPPFILRIPGGQTKKRRTEIALGIAPALAAGPRAVALWTVDVGVVFVADLVEEVDLVLALEQRGCDAVHRRVAPALSNVKRQISTALGAMMVNRQLRERQGGGKRVELEVAEG